MLNEVTEYKIYSIIKNEQRKIYPSNLCNIRNQKMVETNLTWGSRIPNATVHIN